MTKNKALLLSIIRGAPRHLTAAEIFALAKEKAPGMVMATVYNNLGALVAEGEICRLHIDGQADRYDRETDPHIHFICEACGGISDIVWPDFARELSARAGRVVRTFEVNMRGICPSCQEDQN